MGKKKEAVIDRLTQTVLAAQAAGKSYGKYVADEWDKRGRMAPKSEEPGPETAPHEPIRYPGSGPKPRKCAWCGKDFLPNSNNDLCCSLDCRYERKRKYNKDKYRRKKERECLIQ